MGAVTPARRRRVPKQDRSRATRQRLLEAAVACLAERGWAGSTVSVVAERAGRLARRRPAPLPAPARTCSPRAVEYVAEERSTRPARPVPARRRPGPPRRRRRPRRPLHRPAVPRRAPPVGRRVERGPAARPGHGTGGPRGPRDPPHRRGTARRRRVPARGPRDGAGPPGHGPRPGPRQPPDGRRGAPRRVVAQWAALLEEALG